MPSGSIRPPRSSSICYPIQVELMHKILSQSIGVLASPLLPRGNGILLVSAGASGATQTAPLGQCLEGLDYLPFGSAQVEEGSASVLREGLPAGLALDELRALLAVAPVAYDVPFTPPNSGRTPHSDSKTGWYPSW